jgi:hypothetical protein
LVLLVPISAAFEHDGRAVFLFGDTAVDGELRDEDGVRDSIASTSDADPSRGIRLDFNPTYPHVDNIDQGAFCIPADGVSRPKVGSGPGCIIQSDFSGGDHGNFEVVVLEGSELVHYWHDNSDVNLAWARGQVITPSKKAIGFLTE